MQNLPLTFPPAVFFIGIGGIGVSAVAKLALYQKIQVYGTDVTQTPLTRELSKNGAKVSITPNTGTYGKNYLQKNNIGLIVYTTATPIDHPLLVQAQGCGIPTSSYPHILGEISHTHYTIAISGMHGKSTTTSMIGIMLEHAGLDPLVIVGTQVREWKGNVRIPTYKSKFQILNSKFHKKIFVVEADEYRSAMLNLEPDIIVLTRVEEDHLDYYKDIQHIKREFKKYVNRVPKRGAVIANWDDEHIRSIVTLPARRSQDGEGGLHCYIVKYNTARDAKLKQKIKEILRVAGDHNVENALAAYKVGDYLGLYEKVILEGLAKFKGTWRRMEYVGVLKRKNFKSFKDLKSSIPIISDYAHHPTEIKATLKALRGQYPNKRLVLAYQPHQHNRTKMLFNGFVSAFDDADVLIMNEIYDVAGRKERVDETVSSKTLVSAIKKKIDKHCCIVALLHCCYTATLYETKKKILEIIKPNDILIIMGAGDIDAIARGLVKKEALVPV